MVEAKREQEISSEKETGRLEAFSDGICSILWIFWAFSSYERGPAQRPQEAQEIPDALANTD